MILPRALVEARRGRGKKSLASQTQQRVGSTELCAIREPDRHLPHGVMPNDVTLAVAVEITLLDDRPVEGAEPRPQTA